MPVVCGTFWTEERLAQLRTLASTGMTARQVADEMGCSRNAVLGKAWRAGLSLAKQDNRTPEQRRAERLQYQRDRHAALRAAVGYQPRPRPIKQSPAVPASKQLPLTDLGLDMCHWPVSDDIPHCFCGNDTGGHVYCPYHHTLGIDKNQGRRPDRRYVF